MRTEAAAAAAAACGVGWVMAAEASTPGYCGAALPFFVGPKKRTGIVGTPLNTSVSFGRRPTPVKEP